MALVGTDVTFLWKFPEMFWLSRGIYRDTGTEKREGNMWG